MHSGMANDKTPTRQSYDNPVASIDDEWEPHSPSNKIHMGTLRPAHPQCNYVNELKCHGNSYELPHSLVKPSNDRLATDSEITINEAEDDDTNQNSIKKALTELQAFYSKYQQKYEKFVKQTFIVLLGVSYFIYFGFAIAESWEKEANYCYGIRFLFLLTMFTIGSLCYYYIIKKYFGKLVQKRILAPLNKVVKKFWNQKLARWAVYILLLAAVIIFLVVDSEGNRQRLISALGVIVITLFGFVFSKHRSRIQWRQVFWGLGLQFVFALVILRWEIGRQLFDCIGSKIQRFLEFTDQGSSFVFGYLVTGKLQGLNVNVTNAIVNVTNVEFDGSLAQIPIFAFKVLPVIIYFSFFISILYYFGIMQCIVLKLGWLLQVTVGTTAAESINAAANIFIGQTEAPLIIKPFLPLMTKSELHAVMTGGFATIAGGVLAAYINFGVSASHLLSASVMSAPAALGFSKLFYPETEISKTTANNIKIEKGSEKNALEAAANGASNAVALIGNIVANLIAFIAFIGFLNFIIQWFASLVGYEHVTFEWILSQLFIPLAYIMGVSWEECEKVAKLIGLKTVVNEFVAYAELASMLKNNQLSQRAEAIATYALCGFSNISSIGIQLGGMGAMAPERKSDLAEIGLRALIAGSAACFLTACVAGMVINN